MSSNFLQQFMAGWQMGQQRNENTRRDEYLRMQQQEEAWRQQQIQAQQEQEAEERQLRMETYKLQQQEAKLKYNQERLAAAGQESAIRAEARKRQAMPAPTAAEMGVPEQPPEMAGPSPQDIRQARPMEMMPSPLGGEDIPLPVLSERERQEAAAKEWAEDLLKLKFASAAKRAPEVEESEKATAWKRQGDGTYMNVFTGEVKGKPEPTGGSGGGGKGLSQYAESNVINRLSNQWAAATKSSGEISRQVSVMETGLDQARKGNLAAGSQAVLVTFQKILDPTSVVRESEYARSAQGQSLLARMKGAVERLQKGGAGVPLSELEKYAETARALAQGQVGHVNATKERIGKVADRYNIPRELVLENYDYGAAIGGSSPVEFVRDPKTGKLMRK